MSTALASGLDSVAFIAVLQIFDNQEVGVYVNGGAFAEIRECEISGSREYHGVYCCGKDTNAALSDCKVRIIPQQHHTPATHAPALPQSTQ